MPIEKKINDLIEFYYSLGWSEDPSPKKHMALQTQHWDDDFDIPFEPGKIESFKWQGDLISFQIADFDLVSHEALMVAWEIDCIIAESNPAECLTSASEYIRECKKWMIAKKFIGENCE